MASLLETLINEAESAATEQAGIADQQSQYVAQTMPDAQTQPVDTGPVGNDYTNVFDWIVEGSPQEAANYFADSMSQVDAVQEPAREAQNRIVSEALEKVRGIQPGAGGSMPVGGAGINTAAAAAYNAGFRGEDLVTMVAIAMAESAGNPNARYNPNGGTGEDSYGLWQINMDPSYRDGRLKQLGLTDPKQLWDPNVNAKAAKTIWGSQGWGAWSTYTSGKYKQYLDAARAAVSGLSSGGSGSAPKGLTPVGGGKYLASNAATSFLAAQKELRDKYGITVSVISGYRSYEEQKQLYDEYLAGKRSGPVAKPGESNHQSGTALDIQTNGDLATVAAVFKKYGLVQSDYIRRTDPNHFSLQGN